MAPDAKDTTGGAWLAPMVIGVAGKIGSGKSTVAALLATIGYKVIDVDRLGHQALITERQRIINVFGSAIVDPEGQIDRGRLGRLVFRNARARHLLDDIVHPVMSRNVRTLLEREPGVVVIDAALLIPMKLDALCDLVLWVYAPLPLRLLRAAGNGKKRVSTVLGAMRAQRGRQLKRSTARVDTRNSSCRSIYNVATKGLLQRQIKLVLGRR